MSGDERRHNISVDPEVWDAAVKTTLLLSVERGRRVSVSEWLAELITENAKEVS